MKVYRRIFRSERGTSTMELAIAAPLILFILLAAYSLAEAGQKKALVARAAMQGARLAVVKEKPAVEAYVKKIMITADPSIDESRIQVTIENTNPIPLVKSMVKPLKVTVSYDQPVISGFGWSPKIKLSKSYIYEKWDNAIFFDVPK